MISESMQIENEQPQNQGQQNGAPLGQPPGQKSKELKSSDEWTSLKYNDWKIISFLTGKTMNFFIYNPTNTDKDKIKQMEVEEIEKQKKKEANQQIQNEGQPKRKIISRDTLQFIAEIIQIIPPIFKTLQLKYLNFKTILQKDYDEKNPEEDVKILTNLEGIQDPQTIVTLMNIYQILSLKFFKELVKLLYDLQKENEEIIAEKLLNETQLGPQDNTIIQYCFLRYCSKKVEKNKSVEELFSDWKKDENKVNSKKICKFIKRILAVLKEQK